MTSSGSPPAAGPPPPPPPPTPPPAPPTINVILSFLLVGLAWGFTTPFIRRAARDHHRNRNRNRDRHQGRHSQAAATAHDTGLDGGETETDAAASQSQSPSRNRWPTLLWTKARTAAGAAADLLRNPRYAVPLVLNLTGSVWFFLLIGQAELSLTVPVVNTLAFLFTVVGEWWVEGKVISRDTMVGMVLSVAGIALCVHSKNVG